MTTEERYVAGTGDEEWHGTTTGYQYHKCRCVRCSEGLSQYRKNYRALVRSRKARKNKDQPVKLTKEQLIALRDAEYAERAAEVRENLQKRKDARLESGHGNDRTRQGIPVSDPASQTRRQRKIRAGIDRPLAAPVATHGLGDIVPWR